MKQSNPHSTLKPHSTLESEPDAEPSFESLRDARQLSLLREFWLFLRDNKKWWLTPILLVLAFMTTLIYLSISGVAPFIYSLF